jgi:hypothetical protein
MAKKFWMVVGLGTPVFRHETKYQAKQEAERLARLNPTQSFAVLESVAEVRVSTFQWEKLDDYIPAGIDSEIPF